MSISVTLIAVSIKGAVPKVIAADCDCRTAAGRALDWLREGHQTMALYPSDDAAAHKLFGNAQDAARHSLLEPVRVLWLETTTHRLWMDVSY
jgi:hypothetical protein